MLYSKGYRHKKLLEKRREEYKKLKRVYCPELNKIVVFNSKGFHHLRYDTKGRERLVKVQMYKLGLLPLAMPVIKNAKAIHFYKKNGNKEYWALQEKVGKQKVKVKVILRKVGTGNIHFWSIMKA